MIKAVFFDLYNTLVGFWPPLDEIQQASCKVLGLAVSKQGIRKGYALADEFMSVENAKEPLADRPPRIETVFSPNTRDSSSKEPA